MHNNQLAKIPERLTVSSWKLTGANSTYQRHPCIPEVTGLEDLIPQCLLCLYLRILPSNSHLNGPQQKTKPLMPEQSLRNPGL